ncbi:MAG TPA: alanine--glyoxylate aminotransferase family protein [Halococcus sp.]|nr:alanine--glyoxylate aminotransferase family protein [Halococcus sp.]
MTDEFLLLNPGPVPVTEDVREAMDDQMISHRSSDFEAVYERAQEGLKYVFEHATLSAESTSTGGTSLVLNGTATMGMEAAVANLVDENSEVVALVNGKFGRRFKRIAERYAQVTPVEVEWGESLSPDDVAEAVTDDTDLITMVHNETSTGILNPVAEVGEIASEHDTRFVVDGVTSIGGDAFHIDDWNVDIAITDSQKALAAPPGISAMYVTDRVVEHIDGERAPFYADLDWHLRKAADNQTPFTSAVPLFRALAVAVEEIEAEGMETRIRRHRRQAAAFRAGFTAMGLSGFPSLNHASDYSNTVTAMSLPGMVRENPEEFFAAVTERNVSISGGQAHLGGEIFRVSNMGHITDEQVLRGVRTVGEALSDVGYEADIEAGLDAARDALES